MNCVSKDCPITVPHGDVREIAAEAGVELREAEGHPWHCGARMRTGEGIMGTDIATCEACGLELRDLGSPHVNGGYMLTDDAYARHAGATWARVS